MKSTTSSTKSIPVRYRYLADRPVFLVPLVRDGKHRQPRLPKCAQCTCYYSTSREVCAIVTSGSTTTYMRKRKYAQQIGVAVYDPDGIDHHELDKVLGS